MVTEAFCEGLGRRRLTPRDTTRAREALAAGRACGAHWVLGTAVAQSVERPETAEAQRCATPAPNEQRGVAMLKGVRILRLIRCKCNGACSIWHVDNPAMYYC